jgi:hypothetical protein
MKTASPTPRELVSMAVEQQKHSQLLKTARKQGTPLSGYSASRHENFSIRLVEAYKSAGWETSKVHSMRDTDSDLSVYTAERESLHEEIVADFVKVAKTFPRQGKLIFSGGLAGAGKSHTLKNIPHINQQHYLVSSDEVKIAMAKRSMLPKIRGLAPMEAAPLIHDESSHIAEQLTQALLALKVNILWDGIMGNSEYIEHKIKLARDSDYVSIDAIFVDITIETSYRRISARYQQDMVEYALGINDWGGRTLPKYTTESLRPTDTHFNSLPAQNIYHLQELAVFSNIPLIFDNNVDGQEPCEIPFSMLGRQGLSMA